MMDPKPTKDQTELVADMGVGENEFEIEQTPTLKALDVLNWPETSFSTCRIPLKQLLIRFPEPLMDISIRHLLYLFGDTEHIHSWRDSEIVEANVKNNNGGFTALDISQEDNIDTETKRISRDIPVLEEFTHKPKPADQKHRPLEGNKSEFISEKYHGLLLTVTLLAAMTFHALLRSPAIFSQNQTPIQSDQIRHLFALFNSVAFFASLALITLLTHHLPGKPWLFVVLVSTIGAYICAVIVVLPSELVTVICAGICVLIAALFMYMDLDQIVAHQMKWIFTTIQAI